MSHYNLGIDVGGSKILAVVINEAGEMISRQKLRTDATGGIEAVAKQIFEAANDALSQANLSLTQMTNVGIAIPSTFDPQTGFVRRAVNLGWENEPAGQLLCDLFNRPIAMGNDVNCGTLAEARFGAGDQAANVIGLFVGTGLGGGIVIDGKLYTGSNGGAGELGHMIVKHGGPLCSCGSLGCLEAFCSKKAFSRKLHNQINLKGKKSLLGKALDYDFSVLKSSLLAKAYHQQDQVTRKILNKGAYMLGVGCANITQIFSPDVIVLGGGVMEELGQDLMPFVMDGFNQNQQGLQVAPRIELSKLGDYAVAIGATLLPPLTLEPSHG